MNTLNCQKFALISSLIIAVTLWSCSSTTEKTETDDLSNSQTPKSEDMDVEKSTSNASVRVGLKGKDYFSQDGGKMIPKILWYVEEEKTQDVPVKTQIEQHIVLEGQFDQEDVRAVLDSAYIEAQKRANFKHHNPATHYFIYVYSDKARANSKSGNWVGLLEKIGANPEKFELNDMLISETQKPSSEKFNLDEETRKEIFKEIVLAERKAVKEAEEKYDITKMKGTPQQKLGIINEYKGKLEDEYKTKLTQKYKLSKEQLQELSVEAVTKGWPYPESN
jgi:hypothetical protein